MFKKPNNYKRTDIYYIGFLLSLFITIPEIKIESPFLKESGKHKRSRYLKEEYRATFGLKPRN